MSDLTLDQYQLLAARTINLDLTDEEMEFHALFGICSEVGELHGIYQKTFQGHLADLEHVKKEIGDILWMIAELCTVYGFDLGDIAQLNIDKLKARYPDGFDSEHSLHRAEGDV